MTAPVTAPVTPGWVVRVVTVAAVLLVAAVAAVVSYAHMQTVADRAGEGWRAWLLPLSVDGLVVAASMALLTRRRAGVPGGWLAWWALLAGVGASLAANVAAAEPTVTARVVAAWPAVAFAVAFELLLQQRRVVTGGPVDEEPATGHPAVEPVAATGHPAVEPVAATGDPAVEPVAATGDPAVEPVAATGDPAVEPVAATGDPAVEPVGEPGDRAGPDPLSVRLAELLDTTRTEGRPLGRRTVARELDITEYQAGRLLARSSNGAGRERVR